MIVVDFFLFGNYGFKIYVKNRVSEVVKRRYRVEGSFIEIFVRINGLSELMMEFV